MNISYFSGYFDGDGHVGARIYFQKPKNILVYEISAQICSTSFDQISYFHNEFFGSYNKRPEKRANRATSWIWYIKGKNAFSFFEKCIPFLILKKSQCIFANHLINSISNSKTYIGKKISETEHKFREKIMNEIKNDIRNNDFVSKESFDFLKTLGKTKEPIKTDFCYLAGLIDAEGCFRISHWYPSRPGRSMHCCIRLEIGNNKFPIFPWLIERFGGHLTFRKPSSTRQHPLIIWSLSSESLYKILPNLIEFLRLKKPRAQLLLEFHKLGFNYPQNRKSKEFNIIRDEIIAKRKILIDKLHKFNSKGSKSTSLGLP